MDSAAYAAREVPEHPRVGRAEEQLAALGPFACALDVLEDPRDLRRREVGAERQARRLPEAVEAPVSRESLDDALRAGVLPDDRVRDGSARRSIPDDRRLALVRDADRMDRVAGDLGPRERLPDDLAHAAPDLGCVVLDPSRPRQYLAVLLLPHTHDGPGPVEDDGSGTRRALVDRENVSGVVAHQSRLSRTARRSVLPMRDFGSSSTSITRLGTL